MNRKFKPKNSYTRKSRRPRVLKPRILIVCEGEQTETNYFDSFRVTSAKVEPVGTGMNTLTLVDKAISLNKEAIDNAEEYDQVWCVFDKDNFSDQDFNNAVYKAKDLGMHVAYSNEAFELWYLLHFVPLESKLHRSAYNKKLTNYLGKKYAKNCKEMYDLLLPYQNDAIRNAKKLCKDCTGLTPADSNPSTRVYLLVEELNKHS